METIRRCARELGDTPLIGFAGAPFTVATYAIEGKTAKNFARPRALLPRARRGAPAAGADRRGDARLPAGADPRRRAGGAAVRLVGRRAVGRGLRDLRAAADRGAGRRAARHRRAGHLLRQRRGGDPRSRRAASAPTSTASTGACRSTRRARGSATRAPCRGTSIPRAARARSPRSSGARARSSAAAASAGTSSTWDTASTPDVADRGGRRRWWPRSGAHDPAAAGGSAADGPVGDRARADRPRGAEPGRARTRSTTSSRSCAGCSAIRTSSSSGWLQLPAAAAGLHDRAARAAPTSRAAYAQIGGTLADPRRRRPRRPRRSPPSSAARGVAAEPVVAMAAWHPFADEALAALAARGDRRARWRCRSTRTSRAPPPDRRWTSSKRRARRTGAESRSPPSERYPDADGYLRAVVERIEEAVAHAARRAPGDGAGAVLGARPARGVHPARRSLPRRHAHHRRGGDAAHEPGRARPPLLPEPRRTASAGSARRPRRCSTSWRAAGRRAVVVVPIAFTGEHIETLQEIDILYRERAEKAGIVHFARARTVGMPPGVHRRAGRSGRGDRARARLGLRSPVRVTIVGGGISGLAAAHLAGRRAATTSRWSTTRPARAASSPACGATGSSASTGRRRCSTGRTETRALIAAAGLSSRVLQALARRAPALRLRRRRAAPVSRQPAGALQDQPAVGARAKLRLFREPFVAARPERRRIGARVRRAAVRARGGRARRRRPR